jgi:Domain of unknown function (DUF5017)
MKHLIHFLLLSFIFYSCSYEEVSNVVFDVTTEKTAYKKGDTVKFNFIGNPDFIGFYSGEQGFDYAFKDRTVLEGKAQMQFTTYKQNGTQLNSLQLLVSTDFKNVYDKNKLGIQSGKWTDITSRATLSDGADNTPSGVLDISDFASQYKQVYVAFRKMDASSPTLKPNQWTIKNFNLDVKLADGTLYPIANLSNAGWLAVDSLNSTYKWAISSTSLVCAGGNLNSPANEDWVITKALTPLNINADRAIPVKWLDTKRTPSYTYIYNTPGTYRVVFVASNQNIYDKKEITKEMTLVVTN